MRATWRVILDGAIDEALLAVDLYNQPRQPRRYEGLFVHMHLSWLYLLHAEFQKNGTDFHYRKPNGHFERTDGEPKTWDLQKCVAERWPENNPVRRNLELSIGLRNKIEHRYHEAIGVVTAGYAQALLLNFENELTDFLGPKHSLAEQLRFPVFVGSITALGQEDLAKVLGRVPKDTRDFIARFEAGLDQTIVQDQRYEFRINLVPKLGSKSAADTSMTYVREDELTKEEREALTLLGRAGRVIVREQQRQVVSANLMRPSEVASKVQDQIQFVVRVHHIVAAWQKLDCRPKTGSKYPERTIEQYCLYDQPHRDYLYTSAFVDKVVREVKTATGFRAFLGSEPQPKKAPK